jgi:DNA-binding MarR family transcriptional regulator
VADDTRTSLIHAAIARLQTLTELFQKRRQQLAEGVGLTEHQWGVLEEISTDHFMPSMFARQRESSAAAVSKTIRQLVDKGLVEVSLGSGDARQRNYDLSAEGQRVMVALRQSRSHAIERVWTQLDPTQLSTFIAFADDLTARLSDLAESNAE